MISAKIIHKTAIARPTQRMVGITNLNGGLGLPKEVEGGSEPGMIDILVGISGMRKRASEGPGKEPEPSNGD